MVMFGVFFLVSLMLLMLVMFSVTRKHEQVQLRKRVRESACTAVRAIVESLCPWRISFKPYPASWESTLPLSDKRHSSK